MGVKANSAGTSSRRILTLVLIAVALLAVCLFSGCAESAVIPDYSTDELFFIGIKNGSDRRYISPWADEEGNYYCFLPSHADPKELEIYFDPSAELYINNARQKNGSTLKNLKLNMAYGFSCGEKSASLTFLKSENTPTVYIDLFSRSLQELEKRKRDTEPARTALIDGSGAVLYENPVFTDELGGRGNSSWNLKKKPYKLKLAVASDLLGMGSARKWILLANGYDETDLRDKLVYDMAAKLSPNWSPQCEYVNLYVNGEYRGLYLLSEKVEVSKNRLQIPSDSCLYEVKSKDRWQKDETGIKLKSGKELLIDWPEPVTEEKAKELKKRLQKVENVILSEDSGETLKDYIDLDSWARKYLIDEVFLNRDGEDYSAYFYWGSNADGASERLYAGPIWDFDLAIGNVNSKWTVLWDVPNRLLSHCTLWYGALMQNEVFRSRVIELYREEVRPMLIELQTSTIDSLFASLTPEAVMNGIRWAGLLPRSFTDREEAKDAMKKFLQERTAFLDSVWLESDAYSYVEVNGTAETPYYFEVETGTPFEQFTLVEAAEGEKAVWYDSESGKVFDSTQPIMKDTVIRIG